MSWRTPRIWWRERDTAGIVIFSRISKSAIRVVAWHNGSENGLQHDCQPNHSAHSEPPGFRESARAEIRELARLGPKLPANSTMQTREMRTRGFQHGGCEGDLFQGAAEYYARFRRPYPAAVVSSIVEECELDGGARLLDLGCGTGQVFAALAAHFEEVVAIDPDREMLALARRQAELTHPGHVRLLPIRAEQIGPELGAFRMAVCGASFHWMDRPRVADLVYDRLEPGGSFVLLAYSGLHEGNTDWERAIVETIARWLGPERRAGGGQWRAGERHEAVLAKSRFGAPRIVNIDVDEVWTIDEIIGFLYSTSYASKAILGERANNFEIDLRERLAALIPPEELSNASSTRSSRHVAAWMNDEPQ